METNYIINTEKVITIYALKELFDANIFCDANNDLFSDEDLKLFIDNIISGLPVPLFGSVENDNNIENVIFKSGKLRQVVERITKIGMDNTMSKLSYRKLNSTYIKFVNICESNNKDFTRTQLFNFLKFYL